MTTPRIQELPRKLLVIDTSYSLEAIRERRLESSVVCRDLEGYFAHVWSVHPFATLVTSAQWAPRHGRPQFTRLDDRHSFIEGKVGRFGALSKLFSLNFLAAQTDLFLLLLRLIRREQITVLRAGDPLYCGLMAWALARLTGRRYLVRVGANYDKIFETTGTPMMPRFFRWRRIEKLVERFVLSRADMVAGANQDNLDFAIRNGARPERATLFRYGNLIDARHFAAPAERGDASPLLDEAGVGTRRFLIYVGRLEPVKHPDHVVRALADLRTRELDVAVLLAGDGRMRSELEGLARELGVSDHVIFCGNRDQDWLARVLPHAAAVVSPHTGRALAETALAAVPLVAYDVDWQKEVVLEGETGFLVAHGDVGALTDALHRVLSDSPLAARLGINARQHVLRMMDPAALNEHERHTYDRLLERS